MAHDLDESDLKAELDRIARRIDSILKKVRSETPAAPVSDATPTETNAPAVETDTETNC